MEDSLDLNFKCETIEKSEKAKFENRILKISANEP